MSSIKLESNIAQFTRQLRTRSEKLVAKTALGIETKIKTEMAAAKSGREYGGHVASAPGEAPAIDTGELINSIQTDINGLSATVGTNQEKAAHLEFGTAHIAARPFMEPAFEEAKPEFERELKEIVEQ